MSVRESKLWKRAVLWLVLLAPFFFVSYGLATRLSAQRSDVGSLVFGWETQMPFWGWTIVPYWSIDLLYGVSLLVSMTRRELDTHALRLLSAQVIAVSCFLLWPLRFTFERPELDGVFGWLFTALAEFDEPFNQAPSLHIALLVVLWVCYQRYLKNHSGPWLWLLNGWFALIGLSVLTTYQHHFIDLPTGALAGWFCVWLWPDEGRSPLLNIRLTHQRGRLRLALRYAVGAIALSVPALVWGGIWLWLLWPSVSLGLVALSYCLFGAEAFQKRANGRLSPAVHWLFAPYLATAWINSRLWTSRRPNPDEVCDGVWLGRIPTSRELRKSRFRAVVDMCAELSLDPKQRGYCSIPVLDLTPPNSGQCLAAAQAIEILRTQGPLLVCCALGYSRSATAVAAWLLYTGRASTVDDAITLICSARPHVVLRDAQRQILQSLKPFDLPTAGKVADGS